MSKREDIIDATKSLLWEKGYEATSPADIQARSNAGQGSFYHHFPSKQALARVAIEEIVTERLADFEKAMALNKRFRERVSIYLAQNVQPLLGCRVGRLIWDAAIDEEELRQPLARYFRHLESRLTEILNAERADDRHGRTGRLRAQPRDAKKSCGRHPCCLAGLSRSGNRLSTKAPAALR
jgi:AcrR family transcriptional regulator